MIRPTDALDAAISMGWARHRGPGPGQIVARMSPEYRAALRDLTSADVANVREDLMGERRRRGRANLR